MKRTRVTVTDDREVIIVTEQQCDAYLDACKAKRDMKRKLGGQARWLHVAEIPPVVYQNEIAGPSQGQEDIREALTWRFLRDNPRFLTTDKKVDKPKRMI